MDGLVILLIIIGIVSRVNKNKKKQEEAKRAKAQAFAEAAHAQAVKAVKKAPEPIKKAAEAAKKAVMEDIPFTKEEWDRFLGNLDEKPKAAPESGHPLPHVSTEGRISRHQIMPEGMSPALRSTQGESEAEHRRHVEKIAAEEKRLEESVQTRQALTAMNRRKMREAVIMSEVLGKPVALRGRRF